MDLTNSLTGKVVGTLYQWSSTHAYGFVRTTDESGIYEDFFLHLAQIASGKPEINSQVEFIAGALVNGKNVGPALSVVITSTATSFTAVR